MSVSTSNFITSGLVCHLDAYKHSGSGSTWNDLTKTYNATLIGTPPYTHSTKSGLNSLNGGTGATYNYSKSPHGGMDGIRVSNTPSVNSYFTFNNGSTTAFTAPSGTYYTISFYGKADGANSLLFLETWGYGAPQFDLVNNTITGLTGINSASSVTPAGNGWYRYSITSLAPANRGIEGVVYVGAYGNTATQHYAQVYGFHIEYGSAVPFTPSFLFDNSSQYMTSTIPDSFWNAGSWTISAWVNFAQVNKGLDNAIIGHGSSSQDSGLHLGERSSHAYFGFWNNDLPGSVTTLNANTWYNIVFTFDYSTKLKTIYVNGIYDGSGGTVGYSGTGSNTQIGQYSWSTSYKMYGAISSVSFYNRVLSSTEIALNYKNTKGRYLT